MNTNRISKAFQLLRKAGYSARQSFACCQGCAGAKLADELAKQVAAGKKVKGYVFYHRQAAGRLYEGKDFCINYAGNPGSGLRDADVEAGEAICQALKAVGIDHAWNGQHTQPVTVCAKDAVLPTK